MSGAKPPLLLCALMACLFNYFKDNNLPGALIRRNDAERDADVI